MNRKQSLIILSIIIVVILFLTFLSIYLRSNRIIKTTDIVNIEKYIAAYTKGTIQKQSSIRVEFTKQFTNDVDKEIDLNDIFKIYPNVKGEVYWLNDNTIEFNPKNLFKPDMLYAVKISLSKLSKIKIEDNFFTFELNTIKQNFDTKIIGLKSINNSTLKWQKLSGIIQLADYEDITNIERIISIKPDQKRKPILKKDGDFRFVFEFDSIARTEKSYELKIRIDGNIIGVDKIDEIKIEVPALGDFKYVSSTVIHQPEQYLRIQFSDPLQEDQLLAGLIRISDIRDLKYIVSENHINIYPTERLKGNYQLIIEKGIKNVLGYPLKEKFTEKISFEELKPAVRFVNNGNILPESNSEINLAFEAVNLKAVDVKIIKIYENNITQFLQDNNYDGDYRLGMVGKTVYKKTLNLSSSDVIDFGNWNRFALNLNELIEAEPGAIYNVNIGFRKDHSLFNCNEIAPEIDKNETTPDDDDSHWETFENYWYGEYNWEFRDDPCHEAYFGSRRIITKNILVTNIAITAKKQNNDSLQIILNDIISTEPIVNATVKALNFQQQEIFEESTDNNGIINISAKDVFFIIAKKNKQKTYLKLNDGSSLSLSNFDVSGAKVVKGMKGFIFGERDVWRPGDTVFTSFILEENANKLPLDHPILFELYNPHNQLVQKIKQLKNNANFYVFKATTKIDDPTGRYKAVITVGGQKFRKNIRIETIKPNRLKLNLDFDKDYLENNIDFTSNLSVNWLHGSPGKNLEVKTEYILTSCKTSFNKFKKYEFRDITKKLYSEKLILFDGKTDDNGLLSTTSKIITENNAPGPLTANITTRAFENGGGYSINQFTFPYHPYPSYLGIKVEGIENSRDMLETDTSHIVNFVLVEKNGELLKESHNIDIKVYKLSWRWWWDNSFDNIANYSGRIYQKAIHTSSITSKNGKANWGFRIDYPEWGRYLINATDENSGHSVSKIIYLDWPGWVSRENKKSPLGASMLNFTTDKEEYETGEEVKLTIPSSEGGRALVSIENGTKILKTYWVNTQKESTNFSFKTDNTMSPNIYVNVHLLQPHMQAINDLPIRMFGILSIKITDANSKLHPEIKMPDEIRSEEEFSITVNEKNKSRMSYIVAIVDEGLLDLTNYKTPDPWNFFFAREALGVKSWDIYDWVIGSNGAELGKLLSIGGDDERNPEGKRKANRFKPIVKFLGPFHLEEGSSNTHKVTLPQYVGSVRTMIIAKNENAYGSVEKATPVRKPLMVLASLPRVLGPKEKVRMQVDVFTMQQNLKKVDIQIKCNELIEIKNDSKKTLLFDKTGEKSVFFDLSTQSKTGIAHIEIIAKSGNEEAREQIEIDIRNPNLPVTTVISKVLEANEKWQTAFSPIGIKGTNKATLEIATTPPLNLEKRINYLIRYPFGCIEQTTSSVFPLLYIGKMVKLSDEEALYFNDKIKDAIQNIKSFQKENGGFGYWPNSSNIDIWSTSYAGHFLIEAENYGFDIPSGLITKWIKYQQRKAQKWTDDGSRSQLIQAYRLYTLALAGKSEISAMNHLREKPDLRSDAKWRLAAAYKIAGKTRIAEKLVENLTTNVDQYNESYYTYGSDIRDKALILETLTLLGKKKEAFNLIVEISEKLSGNYWLSTQTLAYSLLASSKYYVELDNKSEINFDYKLNKGKSESIHSKSVISNIKIPMQFTLDQFIEVTNKGSDLMHVALILEGIPASGDKTDQENHIKMNVVYKLVDGTIINPIQLNQNTDFTSEVSITYLGKTNQREQLALKQVFPSGWEIFNTRLFENDLNKFSIPDYQDIRDDRVYTFFNIKKGETKTFSMQLNSSYPGKYYLPSVYVEAMYDGSINAKKHGQWVEVMPFIK